MTPSRQAGWWLGGALGLVLLLVLFRDVLLPFAGGLAIAYLLDPATDRLEAARLPRGLAAALVLAGFFTALVTVLLLLLPVLEAQVEGFLARLPAYVEAVKGRLLPLLEAARALIPPEEVARLRGGASGLAANTLSWLGRAVGGLWRGGVALFNLLALLVVTPVVAYYLLRDWNRIVGRIDGWLPRPHAETIRAQLARIDETLAGFVRGQLTVCLLLGAFYGALLSLVGLDFGLVIGLASGILSFIPFFGMLFGLLVAFTVALAQFAEWVPFALVAAVFVAGQVVESQFLTPRLVGERVGLHPVWVIFALLAGGALFGFLGVLLAVPVAASVGVLVRFALDRYLGSALYRGPGAGGGGRGG